MRNLLLFSILLFMEIANSCGATSDRTLRFGRSVDKSSGEMIYVARAHDKSVQKQSVDIYIGQILFSELSIGSLVALGDSHFYKIKTIDFGDQGRAIGRGLVPPGQPDPGYITLEKVSRELDVPSEKSLLWMTVGSSRIELGNRPTIESHLTFELTKIDAMMKSAEFEWHANPDEGTEELISKDDMSRIRDTRGKITVRLGETVQVPFVGRLTLRFISDPMGDGKLWIGFVRG